MAGFRTHLTVSCLAGIGYGLVGNLRFDLTPSASAVAAVLGGSLDLNRTLSSVRSDARDQALSFSLNTHELAVTLPCLIQVTNPGNSTGP